MCYPWTVAHLCNPSTWKCEPGALPAFQVVRSKWKPNQPRLHSKTIFQDKTKLSGWWMTLIPVLRKKKQADLCEFMTSQLINWLIIHYNLSKMNEIQDQYLALSFLTCLNLVMLCYQKPQPGLGYFPSGTCVLWSSPWCRIRIALGFVALLFLFYFEGQLKYGVAGSFSK